MEWSSDLFKETGGSDENGRPVRKMNYLAAVLLLTVCLIFTGIGAAMLIVEKHEAKSCTEKVTGTVVRNEVKETSKKSGSSDGGYVYAPVFEYSFHGEEYTVISNAASNPPMFSEGDIVKIYIDPSEPTKIYVPADKTARRVSWIFIGIGAVPAIAIVIIIAAGKLSSAKRDSEEYF